MLLGVVEKKETIEVTMNQKMQMTDKDKNLFFVRTDPLHHNSFLACIFFFLILILIIALIAITIDNILASTSKLLIDFWFHIVINETHNKARNQL